VGFELILAFDLLVGDDVDVVFLVGGVREEKDERVELMLF
jgi:hypothetical protein